MVKLRLSLDYRISYSIQDMISIFPHLLVSIVNLLCKRSVNIIDDINVKKIQFKN